MEVVSPKLLQLMMKTVAKNIEIEYLHYLVATVNHCLSVKELRNEVLKCNLKQDEDYTYNHLLTQAKAQPEVVSIPKLFKKVERQRKEILCWP